MTDRTASRSDARKRRHERDMADAHATARERDARASTVTYEVHMCAEGNADFDHVINCPALHALPDGQPARGFMHPADADWINPPRFTIPAHVFTQENPMPDQTRHDELKALLSKISEESVTTSNALADMLDLLRERLPESPNHTSGGPYTCMGCGTELYAGDPLDCGKHGEPASADDLPGEPVEPGDLRAGDRVAFAWEVTDQCIACALVSDQGGDVLRSDVPDSDGYSPNVVHKGREWCAGISDVRLIERAPREGEGRDEALARVIFGDAYGSHEGLRLAQLDVALMAREHVEAEWEPYILREQTAREKAQDRAEKAEAVLADMTRQRDEWKARHEALREDVQRGARHWSTYGSSDRHRQRIARAAGEDLTTYLARDDERGAR